VQEPLPDAAWIDEVLSRTARHELVARRVDLDTGEVSVEAATRGEQFEFYGKQLHALFGPRWRLLIDPHSAVVAVTHDPKLDDMVLLEALKSPAFYIGALGSRVNTAKPVNGWPSSICQSRKSTACTARSACTSAAAHPLKSRWRCLPRSLRFARREPDAEGRLVDAERGDPRGVVGASGCDPTTAARRTRAMQRVARPQGIVT